MKIKPLGLVGLLIGILSITSGFTFRKMSEPTQVKGECGEFECDELFAELRSRWTEQVRQYEAECTDNKQIGLTLWSRNNWQQISVACWGDKEADGSRTGEFLGILPYPGEEEKFGNNWRCYEEECEILETLKNTYPEEIREDEVQCGFKGGDLQLIDSETEGMVDVQCVFSVGVIVVDTDNDGVIDGEMTRGTFIDNILGSFPVP